MNLALLQGTTSMRASLLRTLLLVLLPWPASAQAPALPALALDNFPPAARDAAARVHREAADRPDDPDAAAALGRLLHAWEQWEAAHQAYARAQALAPDAFEWPYLDAVILQRLARHAEAADRLGQAVEAQPDYLPARLRLAEALFDAGEPAEARPLFESLVREPAAEPAAHVGLGRIAAGEGRHQDAIRHFERSVALFPELGAAHYGLARAYRAAGRTADAESALEAHARYGARWPRLDDPVLESVTHLRDDARAVLQRGVALAERDDIEGAIELHEAALAADPTLAQAHANLVSLYGRVRNWDKAEAHYRAAVASGADVADAHYDFGIILGLQEDWERAEAAYRQAIAANPLHAPARNNLGQLLERRREFAVALAEYREAVNAQPTFRLARFNMGRMLLALGELQQAVAQFEKLQQPRDEETPRYLFGLATAYLRAGDRERGLSLAIDAQQLADELGQSNLAAAIAREIATLK
jgi:protein O-GlcNAc transferase